MNAADLWVLFRDNASPARSFVLDAVITTCSAGAATLNARWGEEMIRATKLYGSRLYPTLDPDVAQLRLKNDLPPSYSYMAGIITADAESAMRQSMLINATRRMMTQAATSADASAAVEDMALSQAEQQKRSMYTVMGKLAAKTLPLLKNAFEGLLYGVFPFVFLMMLLPIGSSVIVQYLKTLLWLQL